MIPYCDLTSHLTIVCDLFALLVRIPQLCADHLSTVEEFGGVPL